ncbi:MAG: hypothetical protein AAGJ32_07930 [Pseudomonadota bacterium]
MDDAFPIQGFEAKMPYRLSLDDYRRLSEQGQLGREVVHALIDGLVYQMAAEGYAH